MVHLPPTSQPDLAVRDLLRLAVVTEADQDWPASGGSPDDPKYGEQWGLSTSHGVNPEPAWDITTGTPDTVIAILDSGFPLGDDDIAPNIWRNPGEIAGNGLDDDGNGFVDDDQGWDFVESDNLPADAYGHGSNVSSIAGAVGGNGVGVAGVCWDCSLMNARNLDGNNLGLYTWFANSVVYAVDNGADVINMSEGGTYDSFDLRDAIAYASASDVPVVAAMMNAASDIPWYPAAYETVIAVAGTDHSGNWYASSSYGDHVDIAAPATNILGADMWGNYNLSWSGTSMATPHVSGAIGLMLSINPELGAVELQSMLASTALDELAGPVQDTPGWDPYLGAGRLEVSEAVLAAQAAIGTGSPPAYLVGLQCSGSQQIQCSVEGQPGARFLMFAAGALGRGPCPPIGAECLALANPTVLGGATFDANGQRQVSFPAPTGGLFYLQAAFQASGQVFITDYSILYAQSP